MIGETEIDIVRISINDKDFIAMVRDAELKFAPLALAGSTRAAQ